MSSTGGNDFVPAADRLRDLSVDELAPAKSLERIDTQARFILGSVALFGTALSGFGVLGATRLSDGELLLAMPAVLLVAVSLALAAFALVPTGADIAVGDDAAVDRFFNSEIKRRGRLLRWAGVLFALAVLAAAAPAVAAAVDEPSATLDVSIETSAAQDHAIVTVSGAALDADAVLMVEGSAGPAGVRSLRAIGRADVGTDGIARSRLDVPLRRGDRVVAVTARAEAGGAAVLTERSRLTLPSRR